VYGGVQPHSLTKAVRAYSNLTLNMVFVP
jgi:hypothetical protein